jgi:ATP-dependent helicase HrpA
VPSWAKSAAAELLAHHGPEADVSLREALAAYLAKQTGVEISVADFVESALPAFMRMAFKVLGDDGRVLALARDLPLLQRRLAGHAADSFGTLYNRQYHRDGVAAWDFGDLPQSLTVQRFAMSIVAFPALIEQGDACALRLLPSRDAAETAHRAGVRRLFRLAYRRDVKVLAAHLPEFPKMALQHFTLGQSKQLREDLVTLVVDRALFAGPEQNVPRTQAAWEALREVAAARLWETGDALAALAAKILENYHQLTLAMDRASRALPALTDARDQLLFLMPPHFLLHTPFAWLEHLPRYLAAMRLRLEKLENGGPETAQRDLDALALVAPWWNQYLHRKQQHDEIALRDPELLLFRWMLEEYRVHLFAQELGTTLQVSPRRLEKQWAKVR